MLKPASLSQYPDVDPGDKSDGTIVVTRLKITVLVII
jgi:hypothetical protein